MAPQSKKNSKSSSVKKKPAAKKPIAKRPVTKKTSSKKPSPKKRSRKKGKNTSTLKRDVLTVLGFFLLISLVSFAYFLGQGETNKSHPVKTKKVISHTLKVAKKTVPEKVDKKPVKQKVKEKTEITSLVSKQKAKLIIIIDDVHTHAQLSAIKALHIKITPSIFPPYKLSPNSQRLAQGLEHYMIHLPMESGNKQFNTQYKTLKVSFSNKKIENRIKELRILFPKAKYINNHTGSIFTSDYSSMHFAYKVMKENGFTFIDSRTVNSTKVREIAYSYGDVYVARDIFIDNEHRIPYIHKQLKKAVNIAKRKGYAIAIGHPHNSTMQALSSVKDILKDVELIYIDELYK